LQKEDEVTQIMLSKISGIDVMTISQIINLLEKNGFIKRKQHSKDTRANSVFLTSKGKNILEKAVPLVENIDDNFFNILAEKLKVLKSVEIIIIKCYILNIMFKIKLLGGIL